MFGQQNQQNKPQGGFGAGGGGLFSGGGASNNTFGNSFASQQNNAAGPGPTSFGQASQAFGGGQQSSFLGGGQQQNAQPGFGGFGAAQNNQNSFGANTGQNVSGAYGQQQNASSGFGASGFGQQNNASSSLGSGGGLFGQNQNTQNQGGLFGQQSNQSGFQAGAASQPFGGGGGGGLFGQTSTSSIGFGQKPAFGSLQGNNSGQGLNQNQSSSKSGVNGGFNEIQASQMLHSFDQQFQENLVAQDDKNGSKLNLKFHNIRTIDQFCIISNQMLMLYDKMAVTTGKPIENPEWTGQQQWQQRSNQHPLHQQILALNQTANTQGTQPSQQSSAFGQSSGIGQQPQASTGFGGGGFGLNSSGGGGIFGQKQQPQSSLGFGQSPGFGQQPQASSGLGFGQAAQQNTGFGMNKPQANTGFGQQTQQPSGGMMFGQQQQPQAQIGGLFGGQQQQPQAATGGLFGGQQQQQPQASTGQFGQQSQPAGGMFGGQQQQQPSTGGLFGGQQQQQQQPSTGGLFGGGQPQANPGTGGGMFGGGGMAQQAPSGGLFGAKPAGQAQPAAGGLFGGGATGGSGLFGNNSQAKPAGTGLFGGGGVTQTQPSTGGMFGGQAQPAAGGGLFGGGAQPAAGGGLFGGGAQPAAGGGLFGGGAQPAAAGGLFGGAPKPQTGGLFGSQQASQPSTGMGGGLFGGQSASQPATSGLFGGQSAQQNTSLYGQQNLSAQPMQMQNALNFLPNIYQDNNDPQGLSGGFLDRQNPILQADEDIRRLKQEADLFHKEKASNKLTVQTSIGDGHITTTYDFHDLSVQNFSNQFFQKPSLAEREEEERYNAKQAMKSRKNYMPMEDRQKMMKGTMKQTFSLADGFKTRSSAYQGMKLQSNIGSPLKIQKVDTNNSTRSNKIQDHKAVAEQFDRPILDQARPGQAALPSDVISVTLKVHKQHGLIKDLRFQFMINKYREVGDIFNKCTSLLSKETEFEPNSLTIFFKQAPLDKTKNLEDVGITQDCELIVSFLSSRRNEQQEKPKSDEKAAQPAVQRESLEPADISMLPVAPAAGYQIFPSFVQLARMTLKNLQELPSFTIQNNYGKIDFFPPPGQPGLDITEINLERDFVIKARGVEVYDQSKMSLGERKPDVGQKLNVPCHITLFQVKPIKGRTPDEQEQILKDMLCRQNEENKENGDIDEATHISYDKTTYEWIFKVPHFTNWGEEEEEDSAVQIESLKKANQMQFDFKKPIQYSKPRIPQVEENKEEIFKTAPVEHEAAAFEKSMTSSKKMKFNSQEYKQCFGQDVIILKKDEKMTAEELPRRFMTKRQQIRAQLQNKIDAHQAQIKQFDVCQSARPKNSDAEKKMEMYQIPKNFQMPSMRGVRPIFRPQADQNNKETACQLVTFHTQLSLKHMDDPSTTMKLRMHNINQLQKPFKDDSEVQPDLTEAVLSQIKLKCFPALQDNFQLPSLFSKHNENVIPIIFHEASPSSIFRLLHSVSQEYLKAINVNTDSKFKARLFDDFTTICLMNALFGDPRIHLQQTHPEFHSTLGLRNFQRTLDLFKNSPYMDVKESSETTKQRRNAVCEVFRFILAHKSAPKERVNSDNELFNETFKLMAKGDVKTAIRFLNKNGKHDVSLKISQCISAQEMTKDKVKFLLAANYGGNDKLTSLLQLLSLGEDDLQSFERVLQFNRIGDWKEALMCLLLFIVKPQDSLSSVVDLFSSSDFCKSLAIKEGEEDVKYLLLRLYANQLERESSASKLNSFNKIFLSQVKIRSDEMIRWLLQYVLRLYSEYEVKLQREQPDLEFEPQGTIEAKSYDKITSSFINSQIVSKNYKLAFVLCLFLKKSSLKIKTTFDLIGLVENAMQDYSAEQQARMNQFMFERIHLPKAFLVCHQAVHNLSERNYEQAIIQYVSLRDFKAAHSIFMQNLALIFLNQLKEGKQTVSRGQTPDRKYVNQLLNSFNDNAGKIPSWNREGKLIIQFLMIHDGFSFNSSSREDIINRIKQIAAIFPNATPQSETILSTMSEMLMDIERQLKCERQHLDNTQVLSTLINDKLVEHCRNKDLVRRAIRENQLTVLPEIRMQI